MKKVWYFPAGGALLVCGALLLIYPVAQWHVSSIEQAHAYEPYEALSYDAEYKLQVFRDDEENYACAAFRVITAGEGEIVYQTNDRYRTWDLKSISWDSGSCDIIVETGDMGQIVYAFENHTWNKK